jgi:hypothetical protein
VGAVTPLLQARVSIGPPLLFVDLESVELVVQIFDSLMSI